MKRLIVTACTFLFVVGLAAQSRAGTIIDGNPNWYEFLFSAGNPTIVLGGGGFPSIAGNSEYAPSAPWTFTSAFGSTLTVTDAFTYGDQFLFFDNSILNPILLTSTPSGSGFGCGGTDTASSSNPVACLADPGMSHGSVYLAPGAHSIFALAGSPNGGSAYFRVDPVPEPASMLLFGTGALGLAARFRRRRQEQV